MFFDRKKRTLYLFSGTHSVGNRLKELGYEVVSLDIRKNTRPTISCDVLECDYKNIFPPGHFRVIAASVPCTEYSQAKTIGVRDMKNADKLVACVFDIIEYFQPKFWWIENPRTGYLKDREIMQGIPFVDIDYCQFCDWGYKKPTRFWGPPEIAKLDPILCDKKECPNMYMTPTGSKKHDYMLGGQRQKFSTVQKGKIPPLVIDYLLQEGEFDPRSSKKVHFASVVARNAGQQGDEHQPAARHQQQAATSLDGPLPSLASGGEGGPFFDDGIDIKASDTPTSSKSLSPLPSFSFTTSSPLILHQSQLISPSQRHVNRIWRGGQLAAHVACVG